MIRVEVKLIVNSKLIYRQLKLSNSCIVNGVKVVVVSKNLIVEIVVLKITSWHPSSYSL